MHKVCAKISQWVNEKLYVFVCVCVTFLKFLTWFCFPVMWRIHSCFNYGSRLSIKIALFYHFLNSEHTSMTLINFLSDLFCIMKLFPHSLVTQFNLFVFFSVIAALGEKSSLPPSYCLGFIRRWLKPNVSFLSSIKKTTLIVPDSEVSLIIWKNKKQQVSFLTTGRQAPSN